MVRKRYHPEDWDRVCILCHAHYQANSPMAYDSFCPDCYNPVIRKEELRARSENHRAKYLGLPATLTVVQWLYILDHFGWRCAYCRGRFEILDHVVAMSIGGGSTADNVVPACRACDAHKDRHNLDIVALPQHVLNRVKDELRCIQYPENHGNIMVEKEEEQ